MFTLIVNGVAAIKLARKSEFPPRRGNETWIVVDATGHTVAAYFPHHSSNSQHSKLAA